MLRCVVAERLPTSLIDLGLALCGAPILLHDRVSRAREFSEFRQERERSHSSGVVKQVTEAVAEL